MSSVSRESLTLEYRYPYCIEAAFKLTDKKHRVLFYLHLVSCICIFNMRSISFVNFRKFLCWRSRYYTQEALPQGTEMSAVVDDRHTKAICTGVQGRKRKKW